MIILRHNRLLVKDLFVIERIMLKVSDDSYHHALDYSLLGKPRSEVYGYIAGIFRRIGICQTLGITTSDFLDLLIDIEQAYNDNPYHSFYHAVDVTMVLYHMLQQYQMAEYLNRFDLAMLMLAALCHDIGHPGHNNHFEVACQTKRAQEFNNLSVLESYSCTIALRLLQKHNFLRNVESRSQAFGCSMTQNEFKSSVVKMILATDMICHFSLKDNIALLHKTVNNWKQQRIFPDAVSITDASESSLHPLFNEANDPFKYFETHHQLSSNNSDKNDGDLVLNKQERQMMCNILLHAADVSNPCRPWPVFHQLSRLVCVEFFRQGDKEFKLGLPISPNMDQSKANPSNINVGFIDFIVYPYFEALAELFPKSIELVEMCAKNRQEWLKLSTETVDVDTIPSVKSTLGIIPTRTEVTTAAGTVQIPESVEEDIRRKRMLSRSGSFNNYTLLLPYMEDSKLTMGRRKSEVLLHQVRNRHLSAISKRRKSDELSIRMMNPPKFVSFLDV